MSGRPRLTVFGTGYLGTAHAACLASLGFEVLGVDVDAARASAPPGTVVAYSQRLPAIAPAGPGAELAWNPEFLREGHAVDDTLRPDRIVAGVWSARAEATLREVYAEPLAGEPPSWSPTPPPPRW
jgi:UDPglucose 6-dehydrogenase